MNNDQNDVFFNDDNELDITSLPFEEINALDKTDDTTNMGVVE